MKKTLSLVLAAFTAIALAGCTSNKSMATDKAQKPSDKAAVRSVAGVPMLTLNNGVQMPQFGLGTYNFASN